MKRTLYISVPFALVIALVIRAMHGFNETAIWNCLPVIAAWVALLRGLRSPRPIAVGLTAYSIVSLVLVAWFCLAWMFDWRGAVTGSSTSALSLVFVPMGTVVLAGALGYLAWTIADRMNEPPRS